MTRPIAIILRSAVCVASAAQLVRILAERSASSLEWLTALGADLSDVGRLGGASITRAHRPQGGAGVGANLIEVLRRSAAERQIDVRRSLRQVEGYFHLELVKHARSSPGPRR